MENSINSVVHYSTTIEVDKSPGEVFEYITKEVSNFWPEELEGECDKLNDEFIFRSADGHYSKNKIIEYVPSKRVVWLVTESIRKSDQFDWSGTKMIFEITPQGGRTLLRFTYNGPVVEGEYDRLVKVCDLVIRENLYNLIQSCTVTIKVAQSPAEVFISLTDVSKWWSKDFHGNSSRLNDEFVIHHPGQHYSKQKLTEVIPGKKIVWLVTESKLDWLDDNKEEWTDTKMIFDIKAIGDRTMVRFTHEGLVPGKQCYVLCQKGWNLIIKDWLLYFIETRMPSPDMNLAEEIRKRSLTEHFNKEKRSYHRSFFVNASPEEAMNKISLINRWWKKDFLGSTEKLNDTFTVPFGDPSFVDFIVSEFIANKKVGWKVTDCYLPWFRDKKEWNDTEVVFQLSQEGGKTKMDFTHVGLVPEAECYEACEKGWDGHLGTLVEFIDGGQGLPA